MCYISLIPTPFEALIKKEDNKKRLKEIEENQKSSQNNDSQITQKKTSEIVNNNLALKKDLLDGNSFIGLAATSFNGLRGNYRQAKNNAGMPLSNQFQIQDDIFSSKSASIDGVFKKCINLGSGVLFSA